MGKKKKEGNNKRSNHNTRSIIRPRISACMIVKNEEELLPKCLESIKDLVDELIIVDTGSADKTVEIAKSFGAKVFHHPWENDFSKHRNQSISYAMGDWILVIDADEEILPESKPLFEKIRKEPTSDVILVQVLSTMRQGKSKSVHISERLFRNNGKIHYEGRVHNRLVGYEKPKVLPIQILHHGYDLDPQKSRQKFERTVGLLKKELNREPNNPLFYHYLGCSYLTQGMYDEAIQSSLKAITLAQNQRKENLIYLWSYYNAAMSYYLKGEKALSQKICEQALAKNARHIDSHFMLALIKFDLKRWKEVVAHSRSYLALLSELSEKPESFGNIVTCTAEEKWNIEAILGMAYFELGDNIKSKAMIERGIKDSPDQFATYRALAMYFDKKGRFEKAFQFAQKALELNPNDPTAKEIMDRVNIRSIRASKKEPTISCCMIVKNEEAFLDQCLRSIRDYVDEIIVVDTGSTDKTPEIARRYTDKVYFHPWENSFSKARNQSIEYATCDWIFIIDGDEELLPDSGPRLRETVRNAGEADAFMVNTISTYANGTKRARHNSERLFRNNGIIRYEGIVHNRVVGPKCIKPSKIEVMHYGYDVDEKKAYEKFLRTTGLLKKQIAEEPHNPMPHHYLAASYYARGMIKEALAEATQAIDLAEDRKDENPLYLWSHHIAALSYYKLEQFDNAEQMSLKAIGKFRRHLDSYYVLSLVYAEKKDWQKVIKYGHTYLELQEYFDKNPDHAGIVINCAMSETATINIILGHAYYHTGDFENMERHYNNALKASEFKWEVFWNIGCFHLDKSEDVGLAEKYLMLAKEQAPQEAKIWYSLAKVNMKKNQLNDEIECLTRAVKFGIDNVNAFNRLGILELSRDNKSRAREVFLRGLELDQDNIFSLLYLGLIDKEDRDFNSAVAYLMKCVNLAPNTSQAWEYLGEISLELGNLREAEVFLERAINLSNSPSSALLTLGMVKLKKNDIFEFVGVCDRLLKLLGLDRNITLNGIGDLVHVVLDIQFALRNEEKLAAKASELVEMLSRYLEAPLEIPNGASYQADRQKLQFVKMQIEKLNSQQCLEH